MGRLLVSFAVTPYGGVWIEITRDYHCPPSIVSRLMEACGLKCTIVQVFLLKIQSRLMEACGLK